MKALDPIVVTLEGTNLIEASAGTGKTYTITTLFVRLLLERELRVEEILVVTFTKAATAELRDRIRRRLRQVLSALSHQCSSGDVELDRLLSRRQQQGYTKRDREKLVAALRGFDDAPIFTIHGFCQRMLHENAFESGVAFDTELTTDIGPLVDEVVADFWVKQLYQAPRTFIQYLKQHPGQASLGALRQLASKAVADPNMPVLPELGPSDLRQAIDTWRSAHQQASAIWQQEHQTVLNLLSQTTALGRRFYRTEWLRDSWLPKLNQVLALARPNIEKVFPKFTKFTNAELQRAVGAKKDLSQAPSHPFFDACDTLLAADRALTEQLGQQLLTLRLDLVAYAREELRRRKQRRNAHSFDDLLLNLQQALQQPGGEILADKIRGHYKAALIDEFQDTDPIQYAIFRQIYHAQGHGAAGPLFLIGDPKQSIYTFRGADVFAYHKAVLDAGSRAYTLGVNWRTDPRLLQAINQLFGDARAPFIFDHIPYTPVDAAVDATDRLTCHDRPTPPLKILHVSGTSQGVIPKEWGTSAVPLMVATAIAQLLDGQSNPALAGLSPTSGLQIDGRPVAPGDIAILCRKNSQAMVMQQALQQLAIPSVLESNASVFATEEARELQRVLQGMADPKNMGAIRAALCTSILGLGGGDLFALQQDPESWTSLCRDFQHWHRTWTHHGFVQAFRQMLEEQKVAPRLLALGNGERRLTNLLHLGELLQNAAAKKHHGALALLQWFDKMRNDPNAHGDLEGESAQLRLENDAQAVKLVTVHRSKGLEYPIVFCPFMWDGQLLHRDETISPRYHDPEDNNRLKMDLGSADMEHHKKLVEREALAENLRLLYVAMTRSRHLCVTVWGPFRDAHTSPLAYLLHQPAHLKADDDVATATGQRFRDLNDVQLKKDLDLVAEQSNGNIEVAELLPQPVHQYGQHQQAEGKLQVRRISRTPHRGWRVSSFSGLTSTSGQPSVPKQEGYDHDEQTANESLQELSTPAAIPEAEPSPLLLWDFPRGAKAGRLVHEIFEQLDFQQREPLQLPVLVETALGAYGFDTKWQDKLTTAMEQMLATPLRGDLRLRDIADGQRLNELEFIFAVSKQQPNSPPVLPDVPPDGGQQIALFAAKSPKKSRKKRAPKDQMEFLFAAGAPPAPKKTRYLRVSQLADLFEQKGGSQAIRAYGRRVRDLSFEPLVGFLKGYVDLVFCHQERFYVVDYKTNSLGSACADYDQDHLQAAMDQHHYILQYHLYSVALHRYLQQRHPGYDYQKHFGGVFYLFVRGMAPQHPEGSGVFFDRPGLALLQGLSDLLQTAEKPQPDNPSAQVSRGHQ